MRPPCVILDLDGTICELKPESSKNLHTWNEQPIQEILEQLEKEWYMLDMDIYILTGRKEKYRWVTMHWLAKNNVQYDYLIMQEWKTAKKNHIFKEEKLKEILEVRDIRMVYDDNPLVGDVCEKLWIPFHHIINSDN